MLSKLRLVAARSYGPALASDMFLPQAAIASNHKLLETMPLDINLTARRPKFAVSGSRCLLQRQASAKGVVQHSILDAASAPLSRQRAVRVAIKLSAE